MKIIPDIIKHVDVINLILNICLENINGKHLDTCNNVVVGDGYFVDVYKSSKYKHRIRVRRDNLNDLCNIIYVNGSFSIKYSTDFYLTFDVKKSYITANLFECELINLDEALTSTGIEIDLVGLVDVLINCERIYNEIRERYAI